MKNENILDESFNESPQKNRWKIAFLSIVILTIGLLFITPFLKNLAPFILAQYIPTILALYFFIRTINYEEINMKVLFQWSTFIIFGSHFILNILIYFFIESHNFDTSLHYLFFNLGSLFRSIILGNMLSIGVFHLIKNKNWTILILMILMSWIFTTMLIDLAQFQD